MTTGNMAVAGIYLTPKRRAARLLRMGTSDSYPEACSAVVLDANGDNMVAEALRSNEVICIANSTPSQKYFR
jgi:hypothetical protein